MDFAFGPLERGCILVPAIDKGFDRLDQRSVRDHLVSGSSLVPAPKLECRAFHLHRAPARSAAGSSAGDMVIYCAGFPAIYGPWPHRRPARDCCNQRIHAREAARMNAAAVRKAFEEGVARMELALAV